MNIAPSVSDTKSFQTWESDGVTVAYSFVIDYLRKSFMHVEIDGKRLTPGTKPGENDWWFSKETEFTLAKPVAKGVLITLKRLTPSDRIVEFIDGSILKSVDLNISALQTLHISEEARDYMTNTVGVDADGNIDFRFKRGVRVGDPVDPQDVMNYRTYLNDAEGAVAARKAAEAARDAAKASQEASAASQTAAKASEKAALEYRNAAKNSQEASAASQAAAKASEDASKGHQQSAEASREAADADAAQTKDDRRQTGEDRANTLEYRDRAIRAQEAAAASQVSANSSEAAAKASQEASKASEIQAGKYRDFARAWAEQVDTPVAAGTYGAKKYALDAAASQRAASASEAAAKASEAAAKISETNAEKWANEVASQNVEESIKRHNADVGSHPDKLSVNGGAFGGTLSNTSSGVAINQAGDIGNTFAEWENTAVPVVQIECPRNEAAYTGMRWTKTGERHIAAIQAHAGGNSTSEAMLRVSLAGGKFFEFVGTGQINNNLGTVWNSNGNITSEFWGGNLAEFIELKKTVVGIGPSAPPTRPDGRPWQVGDIFFTT
ncbi:hypothetical protein B0T49_12790 [Chromobacterium violaceum]|nr:hypothetical protein B0T48_12075 [Chromobacterium violaceum]OQS49943.1 hypothetical protein B0T49_12790 [Chromobacterium violaceum]